MMALVFAALTSGLSVSAQPEGAPKKFTNSLGMEFALVPKGKSWLGGGNEKEGATEVNMADDFYLGVYLVTQDEWHKVMGKNPSYFSRAGMGADAVKDVPDADLKRFPVENVSELEAGDFVRLLNKKAAKDGWEYRLPFEAEWEFACRGGPMANKADSAFDYYFEKPSKTISKKQANCQDSGLKRTCKVGSYPPNRLGLYDMQGNLSVWCADRFKEGGVYRVFRGCDWASLTPCKDRYLDGPDGRKYVGVRVALVPSTAK